MYPTLTNSPPAMVNSISLTEDNPICWSPTQILAGSTQGQDVMEWDRAYQECYSPSRPGVTYISSDDEADGDNIDPDFKSKLDELFRPVSP